MSRQPHVLEYATRRRIDWQVVIVTALLPSIVWGLVSAAGWLREIEPRRDEIAYQVNSNLQEARSDIQTGDFREALTCVDRARLAATADPTVFLSIEISGFRRQIDEVDRQLEIAREKGLAPSPARRQPFEARIRSDDEASIRAYTIDDLAATMRTLMDTGKTAEALQTSDQILILDPQNCQAAHARWIMTRGR